MPGVLRLFAVVAMSFACVLHFISCHHVHCIIMFSKLASVRVSPFLSLSVLSPTTLARARGMSEIVFYNWPEKCSRNGMRVDVWSYYSVDRPPVEFHRIRSSFDSPTVKLERHYSRSNVGRFRSSETVARPLFSSLLSA